MANHNIPRTPGAYDYPLLIRHLLHTPLANTPEREIVSADGRRYNYETLFQRVARLASGLAGLGVKPGDTVAVLDWDSHRYLECFFAVPMLGAVLHTVNIRLSPEQVLYTVNHAEDDVLLIHSDFDALVQGILPRLSRSLKLVRMNSGAAADGLDFETDYETLLAAGDAAFAFADFDENTRATTFYTTGTTGNPKGVYYSHRQLMIHTLASMGAVGTAQGQGRFHREDVYMPITPMFHVHAWGFPYVATLMGVKQVYPGRYTPAGLLALIRDEGVTFSHCVPTILQMLLSAPEAQAVDLSRWKVIIGGSALPLGLARKAMAMGIDIFGGYGLSETCPVLTEAHLDASMLADDAEAQLPIRVKAGRALPLVDLRVVDDEMRPLPRDGESTGEVVVRAPWLTQGYLHEPLQSAQLWRGGYLHTGDIGHIDQRGYLKVTDRLKDVIKSGGEWISSLQLEDLVSQLPGVAEAAAFGVADERWGERPMVLVVADAGAQLSDQTVIRHLHDCVERGIIAKWAVPDHVLVVESIEKTSVGKIDKKRLRQIYARRPK